MKRISLLAMAMALVMTLAQCKKTETPTNENESGKVHITLDVSSSAKVIISPETGGTAFEQGDKVLVANGGHYVGTLTYNKSQRKFDGDLDEGLNENDYLHFYLLGNKDTEEDLDDETNRPTTLTVNISDQTAAYPEIAYAHSTDTYTEGVTAYKARLLNKCALVKFTTNEIPTTVAVTITGMNNKVAVNLNPANEEERFTYSQVNGGVIALHAESETERWGILLPQGEVTNVTSSADGFAMTEAFTVPEINENGYLDEGIAVNLMATNPVGSINGKFTVAAGKQVYFSQGNLQYQASTSTWRFAEHQYDYVGDASNGNVYVDEVKCNNANISSTYTGWIDLFGWGTSGYSHGANAYQPWSTSTNSSDYHAYGAYSNNLYDGNGQADWGYNAISNGGNSENSGWRTLSKSEWDYVFNTRNTTSGIRYAKATVNSMNGVVLLPDNWNAIIYALNNTNSNVANFTSNTITAADWTDVLEANGAVFLPAAGNRSETSVGHVGSYGNYWMASIIDSNCVNYVYFDNSNLMTTSYYLRHEGRSVRLVHNAQ